MPGDVAGTYEQYASGFSRPLLRYQPAEPRVAHAVRHLASSAQLEFLGRVDGRHS